ncbi:hypothetical protein F4824DRAFT_486383 [Ustulina deusta]|nr:hypothetical protein F4824DRAFT_486383 [Ustulina deusta]
MGDSNQVEELLRRLQDAETRAEREQQRAVEAEEGRREQQRRAVEAEEGRQEQQRRAVEAEEEAEEGRREQLRRAVEAEEGRREQLQRAEDAEERAAEAEKESRPTTFTEYIAACHDLVFSKFKVEQDKALTSKGPVANPRNKLCPTNLKPWPDFLQQQRTTFGQLYAAFSTERRVFENRIFLAGLGNRISRRAIADEKALEYFLHNSVEDPVRAIMDELKGMAEVRNVFDIGGGIVFENHPHALSDVGEEVLEREAASMSPQTPNHRQDLSQLRPDQICVYRSDDGPSARRSMIYVCEYKAPHKLTAPHLRLGLRPIDIFKDVVNRKTVPTSADPDKQFQYHAEKLTAAALTQTYHYMIQGGLEFGLLTTGKATVFLKVDWEEPETLLYHLAEPESEVAAHPDHIQSCAAVGQHLAFGLLALGPPGQRRGHRQDEIQRVSADLRTWAEDFESTLRSIPANERNPPESSPAYEPTTYATADRSPIVLRRRRRRSEVDRPVNNTPKQDSPPSSDDESASKPPDTPSPAARRAPNQEPPPVRRSQRILAQRPRGGHGQSRCYCTQKCLLGLVRGGPLDPQCPNVALHRKRSSRSYASAQLLHPVKHDDWLRLLSQQLAHSLDDGVVKLGEEGARGVLFQVTMLAYGYTFVCKGTVQAFVKDLEHEADVYRRLKAVQGTSIPVLLGAIDLRSINRTYYYDHRVYIIHMTFFSWGGHTLDNKALTSEHPRKQLEGSALRALHAIHREGVAHEDIRSPNMLLNPETQGVMLIDFERALLLDPPRRPLGQLVPNKRAWNQETAQGKDGPHCSGRSRPAQRFANDSAMMSMVFLEAARHGSTWV